MPRLPAKIRDAAAKVNAPLWAGPCSDSVNGGVTFTMLNHFQTCRERFHASYIDGWKPVDGFNHRIEYGNMWHVCEQSIAANPGKGWHLGSPWVTSLREYATALCQRYPHQQEQVVHWWNVCKAQFPVYVEHWQRHADVKGRTRVFEEHVFDVPYSLPSGRTVRLRGKWDAGDIVDGQLWLQENKTKGDVDELVLGRQLTNDLQSMLYLVALSWCNEHDREGNGLPAPTHRFAPIAGVRYNVVRRPLSGGKGSIVRHKPSKKNPQGETEDEYYTRLKELIFNARGPEWGVPPTQNYFFLRFNVKVSKAAIQRFQVRTLNAMLEQLCDWYEWIMEARLIGASRFAKSIHWQHPYGCTNAIDEYGQSDMDNLVNNGSTVGLQPRKILFEELQ